MNLRILGAVLAAVLAAACSKPEEPVQPLRRRAPELRLPE